MSSYRDSRGDSERGVANRRVPITTRRDHGRALSGRCKKSRTGGASSRSVASAQAKCRRRTRRESVASVLCRQGTRANATIRAIAGSATRDGARRCVRCRDRRDAQGLPPRQTGFREDSERRRTQSSRPRRPAALHEEKKHFIAEGSRERTDEQKVRQDARVLPRASIEGIPS